MHVNVYELVLVCVRVCVVAMFLIHSVPLRTELSAVKIYSLNLSLQLDCCPESTVCPLSSPPSLSTLPTSLPPPPPCLFVCLCILRAELSILKFIIPKQNTLASRECSRLGPHPVASLLHSTHPHTYTDNMATLWRCHLVSIFVYLKAFFSLPE